MERHLFIALKLPEPVKTKLSKIVNELKHEVSFKTWVHSEDYHITLAFLGKVEPDQVQTLFPLVGDVVKNHNEFTLNIDHFGFFGNDKHPRIFWAGVEEQTSLSELQKHIVDACDQAGFSLEKRAYSPHITLGRKFIESANLHVNSQEWWETFGDDIHFTAEHIVVYETHFEKSPKYHVIKSFSLNS